MDLWTGYAMRERDCVECTRRIYPGDKVAIGQWKRTYPWGTRTRRVMSHWPCWVMKQEVRFDEYPYTPRRVAGPGKPRIYSDAQRRERANLRVNIVRWGKRQQEYINDGLWAVADGYKDKIMAARNRLANM